MITHTVQPPAPAPRNGAALADRVRALEQAVARLRAVREAQHRRAGPQQADDSYTAARWQGENRLYV